MSTTTISTPAPRFEVHERLLRSVLILAAAAAAALILAMGPSSRLIHPVRPSTIQLGTFDTPGGGVGAYRAPTHPGSVPARVAAGAGTSYGAVP